jgi:hypothetical protein
MILLSHDAEANIVEVYHSAFMYVAGLYSKFMSLTTILRNPGLGDLRDLLHALNGRMSDSSLTVNNSSHRQAAVYKKEHQAPW